MFNSSLSKIKLADLFRYLPPSPYFSRQSEKKKQFYSEENRDVTWLQPGDDAHKVLVDHVQTPQFLSQLELAAHGTHTGRLEVLHSMFLTYASKRIDFDPPSYQGRIQLGILDHNENCTRPVQTGM